MKYIFDIDGTLCTNTDGDYERAEPLASRIRKVNDLYDSGHQITLLTARGMGRHQNNIYMAYSDFYNLTKQQLDEWGVKYHKLFLGKPAGDFYIDDKGIKDVEFFGD
jgi:capsule biosynthesis phosphatase|tara:strand:+ start:51 stop:371 length:321 start_codon:yes stop_codon:yes gene_type:complete